MVTDGVFLVMTFFLMQCRDFPGGPVVQCLPCNAGDMVSWSGNWDPKGSRATRSACHKLSLYATTRVCAPQRKVPHDANKTLGAAIKT